jgi:hypothetical protein
MANVAKKQNMTIAIREYTDPQGQQKKVWKTIGELITWDDGSMSFEQWGPGGLVKGNVFDKQENNNQQPNSQGAQPQQQGGFNQAPQQHTGVNQVQQSPQQWQQQQAGFQGGQQQMPGK